MSTWAKKVLKLLLVGEVMGLGELIDFASLGLSSGVSVLLGQIMVLERS